MRTYQKSIEEDYIFWEGVLLNNYYKFKRKEITPKDFINLYKVIKFLNFNFSDIKQKYKYEINKLGWRNFYKIESEITEIVDDNSLKTFNTEEKIKKELFEKLQKLKLKYE
jgi:hypothetical protein